MSSSELAEFVQRALDRGVERERIREVLCQAGWAEERVDRALAGFADADFPLAVPRPRAGLASREAFLYLLLFTALSITAFNAGNLLFEAIDHYIPDEAARAFGDRSRRVRWSLSSILIAFPLFAAVGWLLYRAQQADPDKALSGVKRWLTYLTLFATAGILIGDLIVLVNALLAGEASARFYLKTATVAVLAGGIFAFYLWDLQQERVDGRTRGRAYRRWFAGATITVVASIAIGLPLTDTPGAARQQRLDQRRAGHLESLRSAIERYRDELGELPPSLQALAGEPLRVAVPRDPVSDRPYGYRMLGSERYELCATFTTATLQPDDESGEPDYLGHPPFTRFMRHARGEDCFTLTVDDD